MAGRKLKFATLCVLALVGAIILVETVAKHQPQTPSRAATMEEMRQLVALVTNPPPSRFVIEADIAIITTPFTTEQIEATMADVKKLMADANAHLTPKKELEWEIAQSNAIVESHSGKRILHVREWYSGSYNRVDQNEEVMGTKEFMQAHPGEYRQTFVSIPNSPFSPYAGYTVERNLKDIQLFKQRYPFAPANLWQALRMDTDVAGAILLPLFEQLRGRSDPNWRVEAAEETLNGQNATRFSFKTRNELQADVWLGQIAGRTVCLRESMTNFTSHACTISEREKFDRDGLPTRWTVSTWPHSMVNAIPIPEVRKVVFKRIDLNPTFTDEEAFAPVFPPDYIVSDVSSGHGVILQHPVRNPLLKFRPGK